MSSNVLYFIKKMIIAKGCKCENLECPAMGRAKEWLRLKRWSSQILKHWYQQSSLKAHYCQKVFIIGLLFVRGKC